MRRGRLIKRHGAWRIATGLVAAAFAVPLAAASGSFAADMPVKAKPIVKAPPAPSGGVFWAQAEYLLWSAKGDRLPALVTTSPSGTPLGQAGVLGAPGAAVLFGSETVNDKLRSGGRIKAGYWFDPTQTQGIEASFFALGDATTNFNAASDGSTILARPFVNAQTGTQDAFLAAYPGLLAGGIAISDRTGLLGGGIDYRRNLCSGCFGDRLDAVIGYRVLRLTDRLDITSSAVVIGGGNVPAGSTFGVFDSFHTTNTFHGLDLGLAGEVMRGPWSLTWLAKLAIGVNASEVAIDGLSSTTIGGTTAITPGGVLAQPTNIGRFSSNRFAVAPELNLNLGYQITPQWRVFAGYNLLYLNNVVRPGGAIDTVINPTQTGGGALTGAPRPWPQFSTTDYWAQGLNVGLALRY